MSSESQTTPNKHEGRNKIKEFLWYRKTTESSFIKANLGKMSAHLPIPHTIILFPLLLGLKNSIMALKLGIDNLGDKTRIGSHMLLKEKVRHSTRITKLSDGTEVRPGSIIGEIDFLRNLPDIQQRGDLLAYTRKLYDSGREDMKALAKKLQHDEEFKNIEFIYGVSHLAGPLAKRLGFDIVKIKNPLLRLTATRMGRRIARYSVGNNEEWKKTKSNFKTANEAFISREKLIRLYSGTQQN